MILRRVIVGFGDDRVTGGLAGEGSSQGLSPATVAVVGVVHLVAAVDVVVVGGDGRPERRVRRVVDPVD